jgi:hypothetical protein
MYDELRKRGTRRNNCPFRDPTARRGAAIGVGAPRHELG